MPKQEKDMLKLMESKDRRFSGAVSLKLRLEWRPSRDLAGPLTVQVRGRKPKTMNSSRWESVVCDQAYAKLTLRTPAVPVFNDITAHNRSCTIGYWTLPFGV